MNCLKHIFVVLAAGLVLSPFTSCKKLLDQDPINSPYGSVFWTNQRDAEQGIAGNYALLRKALTSNTAYDQNMSHFAYGSLPAFEFTDYNQYDLGFLVRGGDGFNNADFLGSYLEGYHDWTPYYKVITQANLVLHHLPLIPDAKFTDQPTKTRNRLLGEAYFLRAFTYFYMARIWGDLPQVMTYDADPGHSTNLPRINEKIILDSCVKDLKSAISLLPMAYTNGSERAVRANKGAAFGLLAHVYMWKNFLNKGSVASDLTNAIAMVDSVVASGQYQLLPAENYPKIFHGKSNEGVFEINMQVGNGEQQVEKGFYYSTLKEPFIQTKTGKPDAPNLELIGNLYGDNTPDVRLQYFFSTLDADKPYNSVICKFAGPNRENIYYKNPATFTGAAVDANIIVMRYADLLLLRAEAYADQGNMGAALADINTVRARAHADLLTPDDIDDIKWEVMRERSRELYAEGQRWFDLVRTGLLTNADVAGGSFPQSRFDAGGWKWPVGRVLFLNNNVITQNPFWLGRVK